MLMDLDHPAMQVLRQSFEQKIDQAIRQLLARGSIDASVTAKLDITRSPFDDTLMFTSSCGYRIAFENKQKNRTTDAYVAIKDGDEIRIVRLDDGQVSMFDQEA